MTVEEIRKYVKIPKDLLSNIATTIESLDSCTDRYTKNVDSVTELENLKREFAGHLSYFAKLVGTVRGYKGGNHIYLEDATKKIKADTIEMLLNDGKNITTAERTLYNHTYYEREIGKIETIRGLFEKVDSLYKTYSATFQAIVQSISVLGKDWTNSNFNG
jgi:hypothetical protein